MAFMAKTGALPRTVGVHQITVDHDEWCGLFEGQRCNCEPEIRLRWSLSDAHN